jgi:hypothetical protein
MSLGLMHLMLSFEETCTASVGWAAVSARVAHLSYNPTWLPSCMLNWFANIYEYRRYMRIV